MYRFVSHDKIDKNKWNGAVHFAHNGNVYGYHWYLNAALREWGAVIEDDYQSVMPVLTSPLHHEIYDLIPQLGPYSVNVLHSRRVKEMCDVALEHSGSAIYPLNGSIQSNSLSQYDTSEVNYATRLLNRTYDDLSSEYDPDVFEEIHGSTKDHLSFTSGMKPELLVEMTPLPSIKKNALMRIMYNAMQRGIGFSNGIKDKQSGNFLASSFFIASHNKLFELFSMSQPEISARRLMMDLVIRNGAGKPMSVQLYQDINLLLEMGFQKEKAFRLDSRNTLTRIKKAVKMPY